MNAKWLTVFLPALLMGCATSRPTYAPDGRQAHSIKCSGWMQSWDNCYTKAGELCGARGYDVLAQEGDKAYQSSGAGQTYQAGEVINRSLLIACK